ncbi:MAG: hypothetical protein ISN64_00685 [Rickettsia sp.]|nr:hypothetical protein [Rickettsia sp.]
MFQFTRFFNIKDFKSISDLNKYVFDINRDVKISSQAKNVSYNLKPTSVSQLQKKNNKLKSLQKVSKTKKRKTSKKTKNEKNNIQ